MQIGLFLPQVRMSVDTIVERVQAAEEAGLHSVWLMDHLMAPGLRDADVYEGWTLLAALAARTSRIRLGLLVGCDAFRHPAVLAKQAVTVDAISGGRLELGLGWGSVADELAAVGLDAAPADRADRLRESLEVLRLLLRGEPVTYTGRWIRLREVVCRPLPVNGSIPIHIGGCGPRLTMPLVRAHADWWSCPSYGVDRLGELIELAGGAKVSVQRPVALVRAGAAAEERAAAVALAERRFGGWGGLIVGSAEEVGAALARDAALGVQLAILQLADFGLPETIAALAREVMPRLREGALDLGGTTP